MDYNTTDGKWGKFGRIFVMVDISKTLVPFLGIDEKKQTIVYEGLLTIYYDCGKVGHIKENYNRSTSEKKINTPTTVLEEMVKCTSMDMVGKKDHTSVDFVTA